MFYKLTPYRRPLIAGFVLLFIGIFIFAEYQLESILPWSDKLLHIIGGAISAWLVYIHYSHIHIHLERRNLRLLIVAGVTLIGVVWEFAEYLSGLCSPHFSTLLYRYFHGGDLTDTLGDLAADILGALIFIAIIRLSKTQTGSK